MANVKEFFRKIWRRIRACVGWKTALFAGIAVALILVDLLTKIYEERDGWLFTVIPNLIEVKSGVRNPGAGFSWLADKDWGQPFLISLTFVMLAAIVAGVLFIPERFTVLKLSLCIIAAGAIGNLIDRLAYGEVRDFIWMAVVNAYCNFADIWIVIGGIIAVIDMLFLNEIAVFPLTKRAREAQKRDKSGEKPAATEENSSLPAGGSDPAKEEEFPAETAGEDSAPPAGGEGGKDV